MEKRWLKLYPPGTPAQIELDDQASLVSVLNESCARFASLPAFHNWGTTLTYAELNRRSRDFAAYLLASGFCKGERIALMMPNLLQYPIALFGALRAGLVVVNTNPLYTPRELEHQLRDSGATCVVILANFAHVLEKVIDRTQVRRAIITELGDMLRFPKGIVINYAARKLKKMVPKFHINNAVSFRSALDSGSRSNFSPPSIAGSDLAFLQYTGGTTGVAKGAMLLHRNLVANLEQVSALWKNIILDGDEIIITALPIYHVFWLTCNVLTFTKHGGLNVLITNPRDIPAFVGELKHWKFTFISGVSTLYNALLEHPRFAQLDLSKLKLGISGGMALQPNVADRWESLTGHPLIEGYGLTEASPVVACNVPSAVRLGAVGLPLPSTEIAICEGDREVGVDESGELEVRGPQVMKGYWNNPAETAQTLSPEGWLRTGDIAKLDADGFVHILDRKKDMIIVSGFKVFPNEIEGVIGAHRAVKEVGCIGVPDDRTGQAIKACVVLRESGAATADEILEYCKQYLTPYKIPKSIDFRDSLPKTNVGKVLRRALLEQPAAGAHDKPGIAAH